VGRPTQRFDGVTKRNALVVFLVLAMPLTLMLTLVPETRRQMCWDKMMRRRAASRRTP
jgi:cytochrome c oxidase assembly factor CtaG